MKNSVMDRLKSYFDEFFSDATNPTARKLFLIVVSILTLDIFRYVRFAHRHVLSKLSDTSLNAYYYALKTDSLDHESWRNVTLSKALKVVPDQLALQPLFLSIDDTMVEKEGEKFELCSRLFDHAAHNGSNYLNGHGMVSILLSFQDLAAAGFSSAPKIRKTSFWVTKGVRMIPYVDMGKKMEQFLPLACYSPR